MGFTVDGVKVSGVHRRIAKMFFPGYSYSGAKFGPKVEHTVKEDDGNLMGMALGSTVDREVTLIVTLLVESKTPLCDFMNKENRGIDRNSVALAGWRVSMHDYTERFFRRIETLGWQPIGSQVACGSMKAMTGTAVDLVCVDDRHGGIVLVELKCGFDRYLDRYKSYMSPPFANITDSPRYQFQVQMLVTKLLFECTYPASLPVTGHILLISRDRVAHFALGDVFLHHSTTVWNQLCVKTEDTKSPPSENATQSPTVQPSCTVVPAIRIAKQEPCALVPMDWN